MNVVRRAAAVGLLGAGDRAAQFNGSTKVSAANTGDFSPPGNTDLFVAFWLAMDDLSGASGLELINVAGAAVATDGWFVYVNAANDRLAMGSSDGTGYSSLEFSLQALTAATWYMGFAWWDNSGGAATYTLDLYSTSAHIGSNSAAGRFINVASPQPLNIGGGVGGQTWAQCRLDKVGIWRLPSGQSPDQGALWNNGAGLTGAAVQAHATLPTGLVDYYDLDEATGSTTWRSVLGTHNATATGTVVSVPPAGQF